MIQVKNLHLMHKKDFRTILDDFSFALNPGDKAVVIGEEGNGKSTLLKWLVNPALVEDYVEAEGERITGGVRIGYLPQELPEEEKGRTIYEFFCEKEEFFLQDPGELGRLAKELRLPADFYYGEQKMYTLSGGQKAKIFLLKMNLSGANVLILDEPTRNFSPLSNPVIRQVLRDFGGAIISISHDRKYIGEVCETIYQLTEDGLRRVTQDDFSVK